MNDVDDLVREFLIESHENLDQLDRDLVALESAPGDHGRLASVFRTIHTIKGTCGFFGYSKLASVAHVGESLLSLLRDGKLLLNPEITTSLLRMVDAVRAMLAHIEKTATEGDRDYDDLIAELTLLQDLRADATLRPPPQAAVAVSAAGYSGTAAFTPMADGPVEPIPVAVEKAPPAGKSGGEASAAGLAESNIRVDVVLLDKLMTLVGELVLARNQILQLGASQKDPFFLNTTQRLNLITSELQEGVMKTRMQPIGTIWDRLPRVVRDLARTCGKKVRVEMDGKDTELDKTIIEAIKDPLTHVVRNSVDHGIESPEVRLARGKTAEGCLALRAFHEGGQVILEISDDGGGIDSKRVMNKALERGLITPEQAGRMSEREMLGLIFLPGFSTAEKITSVSGRGVGMDVVKTNIEKINGTLDLSSTPGAGTTLRIKIPLTLAIIPALIVVSGHERYAIPQVSLVELVHVDPELTERGIEYIQGAPVYRLRGRLLPLVSLAHVLGCGPTLAEKAREPLNLVVLQVEQRQFGLVVDRINDTEEIVVKPLSQQLRGIPLYAGATIMGDGRIALILDVLGIAQHSGLLAEGRERKLVEADGPEPLSVQHACLLVQAGKVRRLAIPLAQVARLEEVSARAIERADEQQVLQYRGRILPLLHVGTSLFGEMPDPTAEHLPLVVCTENDQSIGLLVERILDIVASPLDQRRKAQRSGLLGSAVINNQVTDLMDITGLLESLAP